ncbi:MAG: hypothetical protein H7256_15855 [Bdellovibrio sp.]|nr:hypothetical protein [Bdellovibrio sp.]
MLKASGQIALASTAIYSVSLFSSGGKFGGLTAGAKCPPDTNYCNSIPAAGGSAFYSWGYYTYPEPTCTKTKVPVGSKRIPDIGPGKCPAPYGF